MAPVLQERDTTAALPHEPAQPPRRGRGWVALLAAGAAAAVLVPVGFRAAELLPDWSEPLEERVVDRSPAPLLLALDDLAEYHAATGTFQVLVDVERDTPFIPSVISGERTTFLATGEVDALVDFSDVGPERVSMSPDRRSVTISLPAPELGEATVDPGISRVVDRDRGLIDRVGSVFEENPTSERELYQLAETKIDAVAGESELTQRAEENTRQMLTTLARSLGFTQVTVTFDEPPADPGAAR